MFDIVDERENKPTTFGDLGNGQFFYDADGLLVLKIHMPDYSNAIIFTANGMTYTYDARDHVTPVDVQLVVRPAGADAGGLR